MRAFVTGVAGFVGSNLARALFNAGWDVEGTDNFVTSNPDNVPLGINWFRGDIREEIPHYLPPDVVFHTAAIARSAWGDDSEIMSTNFNGTQNVVEFAENYGALLVHSSSSVVACPTINTYALSKWLAEREAQRCRSGAISLRYGNVYGPGQSQIGTEPNVLASWLRQMREQGWVRLDGDGSQSRDFVHVDDVVRANLCAAMRGMSGGGPAVPVDICTGIQTSLAWLIECLNFPTKPGERRAKDPDYIIQNPQPAGISLGFWAEKLDISDHLGDIFR